MHCRTCKKSRPTRTKSDYMKCSAKDAIEKIKGK